MIAKAIVEVEDYRRAARATDDPDLARVLTDEADAKSERLTEMQREDLADEIELDLL